MFRNVSFSLVTWYDPGFTLRRKAIFSSNSFYMTRTTFFFWQNRKSLVQSGSRSEPTREIWCWYVFGKQYQTQVLQGSVRCFNKKYKSSSCGRLLLIVQLNFFWGKGCWQEEYSKQTREFTSRKRISESNIKKGCRILVRTAFLVYCILCTNLPRIIPAWKHVYFDAGFLCTTT